MSEQRPTWLRRTSLGALDRLEADRPGQTTHLVCAMLAAFLFAGPTTAVELAGAPLILFWFVRFRRTLVASLGLFLSPALLAVLAFALWQWLSLAWTSGAAVGVKQAGAMRWLWVFPMLFPLLAAGPRHRVLWIVAALAAGFLAGNLAQLGHIIGRAAGIDWLTWNRKPGRDSGWWDPVVGGTLLTAALGMHAAAAALARARPRLVFGSLAGITLFAILATGTRGAWIAGGVLVLAAIALGLARAVLARGAGSPRRVVPALALAAAAIALGAGVVALAPGPRERLRLAVQDLRGAVDRKDFTSDTGARLIMGWWALEALADRPVLGVGAGGYRPWVIDHLQSQSIDPAARSLHDHAHNALLHAAATTGGIGLALALAACVLVARSGLRAARDGGALAPNPGWNAAHAAPLGGLAGLALVSAFDSVHVNAQTAALLLLLSALAVTSDRPWECRGSPGRP